MAGSELKRDLPEAGEDRSPGELSLEGDTAKQKLYFFFKHVIDAKDANATILHREKGSEAQRSSLIRRQLRELIEAAVLEGELPEETAVNAIALLCTATLAGVALVVQEGIDKAEVQAASDLFIASLGFHVAQPAVRKRKSKRPAAAP